MSCQSIVVPAPDTFGGNSYLCLGAAIQVADVVTQASVGFHNNDGAVSDVNIKVENRSRLCAGGARMPMLLNSVPFISTGFSPHAFSGTSICHAYLAFNFNGTKHLCRLSIPASARSAHYTTPAGGYRRCPGALQLRARRCRPSNLMPMPTHQRRHVYGLTSRASVGFVAGRSPLIVGCRRVCGRETRSLG